MKIEHEIMMIDTQIAISIGRANFWAQFATSQANQARQIYRGYNGPELLAIEKEQEAFSVAENHLHNAQKFMEEKQALILKLEEKQAELQEEERIREHRAIFKGRK